MNDILRSIVTALVQRIAADHISKVVERTAIAGFCLVLAGLVAFAGIVGLALCLFLFVTPSVGPAYGLLIAAGALFTLSGSLAFAASRLVRRKAGAQWDIPEHLLADAEKLIQENKGTALMLAVLAGLAAGSGSHRR